MSPISQFRVKVDDVFPSEAEEKETALQHLHRNKASRKTESDLQPLLLQEDSKSDEPYPKKELNLQPLHMEKSNIIDNSDAECFGKNASSLHPPQVTVNISGEDMLCDSGCGGRVVTMKAQEMESREKYEIGEGPSLLCAAHHNALALAEPIYANMFPEEEATLSNIHDSSEEGLHSGPDDDKNIYNIYSNSEQEENQQRNISEVSSPSVDILLAREHLKEDKEATDDDDDDGYEEISDSEAEAEAGVDPSIYVNYPSDLRPSHRLPRRLTSRRSTWAQWPHSGCWAWLSRQTQSSG